jgi:hypothetical protein
VYPNNLASATTPVKTLAPADGREFEPFSRLGSWKAHVSPIANAIGRGPPTRAARPLQRFAVMCAAGQPAVIFMPDRSRAGSGAGVPPEAEAQLLDRAGEARTRVAGSVRLAALSHGSILR